MAKYKSPIRTKRKVLFVYAGSRNHSWIMKRDVISASEFVNRLLTFMREEHRDFINLPHAIEGRPQTAKGPKFSTPLDPEANDAS